ncbi:helix-turn-helix domain-containing protein [Pedobacter sp.]|uniref:helix-turn-helix domain-containing protein n=1 Tax=Pedobacter sp. TaxID=1411316 RepID=UPI003C506E9F
MSKNENLKKARKAAGLSQLELARKMGVGQAYVSALENGKVFLSDTAESLGKILDVNPNELLSDANGDFINVDSDTARNNVLAYLKRRGKSIISLIEEMGVSRTSFYYQLGSNPMKQSFVDKFRKVSGASIFDVINGNVQ